MRAQPQVLLVDDDRPLLEVISMALEKHDQTTETKSVVKKKGKQETLTDRIDFAGILLKGH
jgi:hypothetical protein